jgi:hypothetical protein
MTRVVVRRPARLEAEPSEVRVVGRIRGHLTNVLVDPRLASSEYLRGLRLIAAVDQDADCDAFVRARTDGEAGGPAQQRLLEPVGAVLCHGRMLGRGTG